MGYLALPSPPYHFTARVRIYTMLRTVCMYCIVARVPNLRALQFFFPNSQFPNSQYPDLNIPIPNLQSQSHIFPLPFPSMTQITHPFETPWSGSGSRLDYFSIFLFFPPPPLTTLPVPYSVLSTPLKRKEKNVIIYMALFFNFFLLIVGWQCDV